MQRSFILGALFFVVTCGMASAQGFADEEITTVKAEVLEVLSSAHRQIAGTDMANEYQLVRARIISGIEKGRIVSVENDYLMLDVGEKFYAQHTVNTLDGVDRYDVVEPDRLGALGLLGLLFLLTLFTFGGKQGLRGLIALVASFIFIYFALLPGIMAGYSPVLVSIAVSGVIIICGSYVTHGVNRTTSSAVVGMLITITLVGFLATYAIASTRLSGDSGHETLYLLVNSGGNIDLAGILLGGMLIGLLGVLYDAAIGQAVAIEELLNVATHHSRKEIFRRAMRIGREHIGALVNTLAIAYTGAALPLILLYYSSSDAGLLLTINREIFATEIVRILVGSIGLILAVPITSVVAMYMLRKKVSK